MVPMTTMAQTPTGVFPVVEIVKIRPTALLGTRTTEDVPRDTVKPSKPRHVNFSAVRDTGPEKPKRLLTPTKALPVDPRTIERWSGKIAMPKSLVRTLNVIDAEADDDPLVPTTLRS